MKTERPIPIWTESFPGIFRVWLGTANLDELLDRENIRTRLRDMWNLRALMHTDGSLAPVETNHTLEQGAPRELRVAIQLLRAEQPPIVISQVVVPHTISRIFLQIIH